MASSVTPDIAGLRALSHPVRLRMLGLLRTEGPATATTLAQRLDLNTGATSYHLRQLAQHGFIERGHRARQRPRPLVARGPRQHPHRLPRAGRDRRGRRGLPLHRRPVVRRPVARRRRRDALPAATSGASVGTLSDWEFSLTPAAGRRPGQDAGRRSSRRPRTATRTAPRRSRSTSTPSRGRGPTHEHAAEPQGTALRRPDRRGHLLRRHPGLDDRDPVVRPVDHRLGDPDRPGRGRRDHPAGHLQGARRSAPRPRRAAPGDAGLRPRLRLRGRRDPAAPPPRAARASRSSSSWSRSRAPCAVRATPARPR